MTNITKDVDFYRSLWERLVGQEFTTKKLADRVHRDGGYDIENLTESDLIELMEGRFRGPLTEPAFSFSELIGFYSVPGAIQVPEQVVGWVFASFVVADVIRKDLSDWELQMGKLLDGLMVVRNQLEAEELVQVFQRVFCDEADGATHFAGQQGR